MSRKNRKRKLQSFLSKLKGRPKQDSRIPYKDGATIKKETEVTVSTSKTGWKDGVGQSVSPNKPSLPNRPATAALRFSPYAWAKFKYLRDKGDTEVGAYGITEKDDPLAIIDVIMIKQEASAAHVDFDDEAIADFFEDQVELGRKPSQFARIWLHTHPGNCAIPSSIDEDTFTRVFGRCDWAVMAILARGGDLSARLRYNTGVRAEFQIKVEIDYEIPFGASNHRAWSDEYKETLTKDQVWRSQSYGSPCSPNWHGHMPGQSMWESQMSACDAFTGSESSRVTSPRSRGIIIANAAEKGEEDPITQLSSDDGPVSKYWPLEIELEDKTVEEKAELLHQLQLTEDDINDYICYYDDQGTLTCELNPDVSEQEEEAEAGMGFTDEAGDLIMHGFINEEQSKLPE
jgi:hypothetical protein